MNVKYYPHLVALVMVVGWLSFGNGCRWEEPVEVGSMPAPLVETTPTIEATPVLQAAEITEVECEHGKAHAFYPEIDRFQLGSIHATGHLIGQPGDYLHKQVWAYVVSGEAWVDCDLHSVDYVTFIREPSAQ